MTRKRDLFSYFLIIAVVFGIYSNTLWHSFTYDDHHYIVESEYIKGWKGFFSIFGRSYLSIPSENLDHTRPFMPFSLTMDYTIWGLNPFGYHLTNTVIHALNSVLLYNLISYISSGVLPLFASLLFAVHPIHVEPVVGITFREDLLVTFFYLSSFLLYVRFVKDLNRWYYLSSIFSFILALLSKEMAVTLPLVLLSYDYFLRPKEERPKWTIYLPYWGLFPFYLFFLYVVYSNLPTPPAHTGTISDIAVSILRVIISYIKLLLFPFNLHVDYLFSLSDNLDWTFFFYVSIVILSCVYLVRSRDKLAFFCVAFFFVSLLPVLNIIPTFRLVADRFLYLPSVGFCIFLGIIIQRSRERINHAPLSAMVTLGIAGGIFALYSVVAIERGKVWENDFTLWSNVLRKSPFSVRAYTALGAYYQKEGRDDEALIMLKKAVELRPDYDKGYYNIGAIYLKKGYTNAAIPFLRKAVEINPNYGKAHFNLGLAFMQMSDYDKAVSEYEMALSLMPNNVILYNNLGNAYSAKGMHDMAIRAYEKAISLRPDYAEAYYNLGNAFAISGRYTQALGSYEKAAVLNPLNASAYFNMGNVHLTLGQTDKAKAKFEEALRINPMHRGARDALESIKKREK